MHNLVLLKMLWYRNSFHTCGELRPTLFQRSTQEVEGPHSSSQEQPTTQGLWCILRLVALMNLQLQDVGSVVGQKPRQPPHPMQVGTSVADQTLPSRQQTAPRQQQLQVGLSMANQTLPSRQQTAPRQQQLQVGLSVADQTLPSRQQQLQVDLSVADQKLPTRQQAAPRQQILPSRQQLHHWIRHPLLANLWHLLRGEVGL